MCCGLFPISKEHQITTAVASETPLFHCFPFQKSIKSQLVALDAPLAATVSHFKRASNHNRTPCRETPKRLFPISKEHQITTNRSRALCCAILFPISKEHQITTRPTASSTSRDCFPFQKSIKSQHGQIQVDEVNTVSHFKRASNHNQAPRRRTYGTTVSHFKRASNHNTNAWWHKALVLFPISKEHQITTTYLARISFIDCFPFQKSIKSQHGQIQVDEVNDCFPFQKSIKSQHAAHMHESQRDCFPFQKSIKSQLHGSSRP